jgi:hypothetical protein
MKTRCHEVRECSPIGKRAIAWAGAGAPRSNRDHGTPTDKSLREARPGLAFDGDEGRVVSDELD